MGLALQVCSVLLMIASFIIIVSCLFLGEASNHATLILSSVIVLCFCIFVFKLAYNYSEFTGSPEYSQYQLRVLQENLGVKNGKGN